MVNPISKIRRKTNKKIIYNHYIIASLLGLGLVISSLTTIITPQLIEASLINPNNTTYIGSTLQTNLHNNIISNGTVRNTARSNMDIISTKINDISTGGQIASTNIVGLVLGVGNIIGTAKNIQNTVKNFLPNTCNSVGDIINGCAPSSVFCRNGSCNVNNSVAAIGKTLDTKIMKTGTLGDAIIYWTNFAMIFLFVVAVSMIIYAGYLMITDIDGNQFSKGLTVIKGVAIGIIFISVFAYGLVNTIVSAVG